MVGVAAFFLARLLFFGVEFGVPFFGCGVPAGVFRFAIAVAVVALPLLRRVDLDGVETAEGLLVSLPLRAPVGLSAVALVFRVNTSSSASSGPESGSRSELECSATSKSLSSACLPDLRLLPVPSSRKSVP